MSSTKVRLEASRAITPLCAISAVLLEVMSMLFRENDPVSSEITQQVRLVHNGKR